MDATVVRIHRAFLQADTPHTRPHGRGTARPTEAVGGCQCRLTRYRGHTISPKSSRSTFWRNIHSSGFFKKKEGKGECRACVLLCSGRATAVEIPRLELHLFLPSPPGTHASGSSSQDYRRLRQARPGSLGSKRYGHCYPRDSRPPSPLFSHFVRHYLYRQARSDKPPPQLSTWTSWHQL